MFEPGATVYVASEMRYYGRAVIERAADHDPGTGMQTYIVVMPDGRRGRVAADQMHATRADARAFATQTIFNR